MPAKEFDLPDIGTVYVYKRRGARNIRLSVNSDGKVRVTIPAWVPYKAGVAFAVQKQSWLAAHTTQKSDLEDGQRIGKYHTLRLLLKAGIPKPQSRVSSTQVAVSYPSTSSPASIQAAAHSAAQRALKAEADRLLPQRLRELATTFGFDYTGLTIRHLKTRWGSCNSKQEITLNYYLMQLPWELIDYVLVHELVHTQHLHHGKDFWQAVEQCLPNFKERRKQLKQYQPSVLAPINTRSMA